MGLIDKIKNALSFGGQPESDLSAADFESEENGGGENQEENEDSEEGEDDSENENGNSENEESEENESEENESGNGEDEEDDSENEGGEGENEENPGENGESEENEGGEGENEDSSQGNNEDSNESENELEDIKEDMAESSAERDMSGWEGYEGDKSNFIDQHFENLQEKRADPTTEIGTRKKDRDERMSNTNISVSAETVLEKYENRFADEIQEAFRKIKTREAPKPAEYGQRINMRGVIRRRAGDPTEERLYMEMDQSEVGDRCITVVVDSSGSMDELEIKLALMALSDACEQIGDRFTATNYCTERTRRSDPGVKTDLITAPTEQFKKEHLNSFNAHGYTPTSSGILDGRSLSDITPNSEDVIIVITDGVANVDIEGNTYSEHVNNDAMDEAEEQFNAAVNEGKRVIGIGVGRYLDDASMKKIFGNSYIRTDMDKIADSLVEIYRQQMKSIKN